MKISNYFSISQRKLRRIFLILIIFSNFNLSNVSSENKTEDISEYKKNLFSCNIGLVPRYQLGVLSKKEIDRKINQCEKSLKEEKNIVREIFTRNWISKYYGFYKSKNKYDEYFDLNKEKKRISLYKTTLKLFDQITDKDIDEYNQSKILEWRKNTSKIDLIILKQVTLSKLGTQYFQLKQYKKATNYLLEANKLFIKDDDRSERRYLINNGFLANIYYSQGEIQKAKSILEKNIVNFKCKTKKNCIQDKILLNNIYNDLYQYEDAYEILESITKDDFNYDIYSDKNLLCNFLSDVESRKISYRGYGIKVNLNNENQNFLKNCNASKNFYHKAIGEQNEGKYDEAIESYKIAREIILETFDNNNLLEIANIDLGLGYSYVMLGKIELAKKHFDSGFQYYDKNWISYSRYFNSLRFAYSLLLFDSKEFKDINLGLDNLKKAFGYELLIQQKVLPNMSLDQRLNLNKKNEIFNEPYNALFSLPGYLESIGFDSNRGNEIALFARINFQGLVEEIEKKQAILANSKPEEKKIYQQIKLLESKLSNINLDKKAYKKLNKEKQLLEVNLYKSFPYIKPKLISSKQISKLMPRDSVLIEFQEYEPFFSSKIEEKEYIALILFPNNKIISVKLGKSEDINKNIKLLNNNIVEGNKKIVDNSLLSIYLKIFKPLNNYLKDVKTIFISPDSDINLIPFNALKIENGDSYLSERYDLKLVANAKELLRILDKKKSKKNNNESIVFSNPDFYLNTKNSSEILEEENKYLRIGNSCREWNYLEGTIEEGNQIKRLINAKLFTGKNATVKNLQNLNLPPKVLHMATHGYFCDDENFTKHPLIKSGVVLAGANNSKELNDDGYLTSYEASKLNLENTKLVVLSACNTALGDIEVGSGILGLRRALSVAGARSTLLSLWAVDDFATRAFMTSFYQKLKSGNNLREALIVTQREFRNGVINSGDPDIDWSEEFYWGAFQLSGDSSATLFN